MKNHNKLFIPLFLLCCQVYAMDQEKNEIEKILAGNTMIITNKYGPSFIYFDPSGAYRMSSLDRITSEGKWRATADSVCSTTNPTPEGKVFPEHCMNMKGRGLNDVWSAEDPRNGKMLFKLIRGGVRQVPPN